jgi:hypothetical protein
MGYLDLFRQRILSSGDKSTDGIIKRKVKIRSCYFYLIQKWILALL